jgi:hypothetical protein
VRVTAKGAALSAGAGLAAGWGLQQLYKATGKYPPQPVFWAAVGVGAFLLTHAAQSPLRLKG